MPGSRCRSLAARLPIARNKQKFNFHASPYANAEDLVLFSLITLDHSGAERTCVASSSHLIYWHHFGRRSLCRFDL